MGKNGKGKSGKVRRYGRIRRAEVNRLLEELENSLEYPQSPPFCLILNASLANDIWLDSRDKLHELGEDENPRLKKWERKFVRAVSEYGINYREKYRASKPLSYWWWWLDKIMDGELSKDLLPEHVRDLIS